MNKTKYTCDADSLASLHVVERDMDRLSFITEREGSWTGSAWLSREDATDLARRLAEHVGLTVEPEPFQRDVKFEDIRKGDLVRVEWTQSDVTVVRTGVADARLPSGWYSAGCRILYPRDSGETITILSRPEPDPDPLPTTPGAVIKLWLGKEFRRTTLGADGYWRGAWPGGDEMDSAGDELADLRGTYWDRFEVIA